MASRVKKTARKKTAKKTVARKKAAPKKAARKKAPTDKALLANKRAHWKAYRELQKQIDTAWKNLQSDVKRKASTDVLIQNKNHLLLLLGECNYMTRECMKLSARAKKGKLR